ncbi:MAG: cell division protein ZapA [Polymorphobacter sp.]|uniref:cell division protein ZapA n=1 Tax=Polymorphobacter sp. TaxID=1909290 RepID=UPI003A865206
MAQVTVEIAGRSYPLSCRDGDEPHLESLAASLARKADGLLASLGPMSEARLMLMTALMVADELHDSRAGKAPPPLPADPAADARLAALTARIEALTARLERKSNAA